MFPDVVVIGGGIIGCSCAYYLSREGLKVQLVEKGPMGSGTSKAGQCHIMLWELPEINVRLAEASKHLYEALSREAPVDIEYRRTGSLAIVGQPEDMESFGETVESLRDLGLNCRLLNADELLELEPNAASDVGGGAYFPDDAQVNPLMATWALAQGARAEGAIIQAFTEVTGIDLSPGKKVAAVNTTAGKIPTEAVVNAAGPWSVAVGEMVGLDIPVTPRRGHLVVTEPVADDIIHNKIILAAGYIDSLEAGSRVAVAANVQQTRNGSLVLGSSREFVGFDRSVNPEVVSLMLDRCLRFFPCLAGIHAIRAWAGLRPYSPDLLPIIGAVDSLEGFYVATGHEGIGITLGPITGKLMSQVITGQEPDIPLEALAMSRFAGTG